MIDQQRVDLPVERGGGLRGFGQLGGQGFVLHEAADFLALARAQIGRHLEGIAPLHEGVHDGKAERFGEFAQLGQRRFELGIAHVRPLDRGDDGVFGLFLDFCLHAARASRIGQRRDSTCQCGNWRHGICTGCRT